MQRCRTHKLRNVIERLPTHDKMLRNQVRSLLRAAWRLPQADEGMARMKKLAEMIERDHPEAAASLREGLRETFTINRHDVPPSLHRCLATTNIIESPQSGVRKKTGNVCRWRDGEMILRWVAGAFLLTEKNFRKITGYPKIYGLWPASSAAPVSLLPLRRRKWRKMNSTRRPNLQRSLGHPRLQAAILHLNRGCPGSALKLRYSLHSHSLKPLPGLRATWIATEWPNALQLARAASTIRQG